jgi:hypothetical protein
MIHRRRVLQRGAVAALPLLPLLPLEARAAEEGAGSAEALKRLREGGCVIAFRHALAPGTFDPPEFKLGDCSTQRNLSEEGRAQARRIGVWFRQQGLVPAAVRSSPWCRCVDTGTLAFGQATPWAALGSPRGAVEGTNEESLQALRLALQQSSARPGRFEIWVTHMFVLSDLLKTNVASGEGLVVKADPNGSPTLLARLLLA